MFFTILSPQPDGHGLSNMSRKNKINLLSYIVDLKIEKIKKKSQRNKLIFQILTASSIVFSASIALITGWDWHKHIAAQKNTTLIIGVILTIINGWVAIFDYKKLWVRQKSTLFSLYQLQNELIFFSEDDIKTEKLNEIFEKYQLIWVRDTNNWRSIYTSTPEKKPAGQK